jgi:hypothetical protein
VAQAVECLPTKSETLNSKPGTTTKKQKNLKNSPASKKRTKTFSLAHISLQQLLHLFFPNLFFHSSQFILLFFYNKIPWKSACTGCGVS